MVCTQNIKPSYIDFISGRRFIWQCLHICLLALSAADVSGLALIVLAGKLANYNLIQAANC